LRSGTGAVERGTGTNQQPVKRSKPRVGHDGPTRQLSPQCRDNHLRFRKLFSKLNSFTPANAVNASRHPMKPNENNQSSRTPEKERLAYSIQEAADMFGVDYFSVYRLIQRGKLKACRALREKFLIARSELLRLANEE
jgi:excisionase family DNA binding protein